MAGSNCQRTVANASTLHRTRCGTNADPHDLCINLWNRRICHPVHWDDVLICVDYHATSIPHVATNLVSEERSPMRPLDHSSPKMGSTSTFALIPSHTFGPAGAVYMWALPECCLSSSGCLPGPSEDFPVVSGGQGNCIQIIQQWHCILWLFHTCSYIFHRGPFRCLP